MTPFQDENACLFINVDRTIDIEQIKILVDEFSEFKKDRTNRWNRMFFDYFYYIRHDSYRSFVFVFYDEVLSLSKYEQEKLKETTVELFNNTLWFQNFVTINSIKKEVGTYDKETFDNGNFVETYIESSIMCGYKISDKLLKKFLNQT